MSMDTASMVQMCALCLRPDNAKISEIELRAIALEAKGKLVFCYDNKHNGAKFHPFTEDFTSTDLSTLFAQLAVGITGFKAPFFHPKIILLHYTMPPKGGNAAEDKFRLLVSSKNLTTAHMFETGVWLESTPVLEETLPNHNLNTFLSFLKVKQPQATNPVLNAFADYEDWGSLAFVLPAAQGRDAQGAVEVRFSGLCDLNCTQESLNQALQKDLQAADQAKQQANRLLKFCSLKHWLNKKTRMVILSPDYETPLQSLAQHQIFKPQNLPTHAKLYYHPAKKCLWLGSSNCSEGGMQNNIECMVQLQNVQCITIDPKSDTVTVFGIPCERVTQSKMVFNNNNETALQAFINSHAFEIEYFPATKIKKDGTTSKSLNAKVTVTVPLCPTAQNTAVAVELLPAGFAETNTDGITPKWQPYCTTKQTFKFEGTTSTKETGWLRLKLDDTECQICCDPNIGQTARHGLFKKVWADFAYRAWYDEFMATQTAADAKVLLEEATKTAAIVQAHCKADSAYCAEQADIVTAAQYYYDTRAKR